MASLAALVHRITGRQYHFKVLLKYTPDPKNGQSYVTRRMNCWVTDRSLIANDRAIKKALVSDMIQSMPAYLKRNGKLELAEVYYLGWFKPHKQ